MKIQYDRAFRRLIWAAVICCLACGRKEPSNTIQPESQQKKKNTTVQPGQTDASKKEKKPQIADPFKYYPLTKSEQIVLKSFLSQNADWRLALPSDNQSRVLPDLLRERPGYEPYFLRADFNFDGKDDMIAAFKNRKKGNFGIAYFITEGSVYSIPQWLSKTAGIVEGGLFISKGELFISGCFYCDNIVVFQWDKEKHRFSRVENGENDD